MVQAREKMFARKQSEAAADLKVALAHVGADDLDAPGKDALARRNGKAARKCREQVLQPANSPSHLLAHR